MKFAEADAVADVTVSGRNFEDTRSVGGRRCKTAAGAILCC